METSHVPTEAAVKRSLLWDKIYYTPFSISRHSHLPAETLLGQAQQEAISGDIKRVIQLSRTVLKDHHDDPTRERVVDIMADAFQTRANKYEKLAQQESRRRGWDWFKGQMDGSDYEVIHDHALRRQIRWERYQNAT